MTDLTRFRDHCRHMATAEHQPECLWVNPTEVAKENRIRAAFRRMFPDEPAERFAPIPECAGCVSDSDRALFARLAAEVDEHLDPHPTLWETP